MSVRLLSRDAGKENHWKRNSCESSLMVLCAGEVVDGELTVGRKRLSILRFAGISQLSFQLVQIRIARDMWRRGWADTSKNQQLELGVQTTYTNFPSTTQASN